MFSAYMVKHGGQWYRVVSHAFIHAGWMHLAVNMWVLYLFGGLVEDYFAEFRGIGGQFAFVALYLGGILFATLPSYSRHQDNFSYNSLGASGAVAAVLFSSIYFQPTMDLYLMLIPIPIPAIIFGIGYLALEWYLDKKAMDNVAHDAHFWGAGFGFIFTVIMVPDQMSFFLEAIANKFMP
ncbi:MAG: hypothetical protein RL266_1996 [Bacteroidota bacterium]